MLADFICPKCKHKFEAVCKQSEEIKPCKRCEEYAVRLTVQKPGYRTDHTWDS